jgi:lipoyl(octanoyl) transferase
MKLEIKISPKPVEYQDAIKFLEERVAKIQNKESSNLLWILEHPNLYSAGTSAKEGDLLNKDQFPIYKTSRGGQWTFHGDGQKVIYFAIDLNLEKIAAIGIRVKKWVAFHGFSLNVNVNKKNYEGIIPCGISDKGIANMIDFTDLSNLGDINEIIIAEFKKTFPNTF